MRVFFALVLLLVCWFLIKADMGIVAAALVVGCLAAWLYDRYRFRQPRAVDPVSHPDFNRADYSDSVRSSGADG